MSLGNLSVRISADINGFTSSMDQAANVAKSRMGQSSDAVGDFRSSLLQASADMQRAALAMGSSMQAANQAIIDSSNQSSAAIQGIAASAEKTDFTSLGQRVGEAIKAGIVVGISAGVKAWDDFKEKSKTAAIATGLIISAVLAGTVAGTVYTAYKVVSASLSAISGMMDGSFFKSENIDSVIKTNDAIKDLQKNLQISSIEAGALNDALRRLGVDPGDYKAVYQGLTNSIHTNGEELDRLGVKYKDANGQFLAQEQILQNAKAVLDQYREGWDRAQAAATIGMGTYDQITQALKANSQEQEASAARLNDYQLGMSQYGQDALAKYQQTMREFDNENRLFSDGIKRVWSDAVLPAYTSIASVFKEGFPGLVQAFRVVVSSVVGLGYAMADGIYIAAKSVTTALGIINDSVNALDKAVKALASGDIKGAGSAIVGVWDSAKERVKSAGKDMVDVIMSNDAKIKFAMGQDGRNAPIKLTKDRPKAGRTWQPKPDDEDAASQSFRIDPFTTAMNDMQRQAAGMQYVIDNFDRLGGKVRESKAAMAEFDVTLGKFSDTQRVAANLSPLSSGQKAAYVEQAKLLDDLEMKEKQLQALKKFDDSVKKLQEENAGLKESAVQREINGQMAQLEAAGIQKGTDAYEKRKASMTDAVQGKHQAQFDVGMKEYFDQQKVGIDNEQFMISLLGQDSLAVAKLTAAHQIDEQVQEKIRQARRDGVNLSDEEIAKQMQQADAIKQTRMAQIDLASAIQKTPEFGAHEAIRKYQEAANDAGAQVENTMTNALKGVEDAFVQLSTTGKLSFKSLADSIVADIARMGFKSMISSALGYVQGGGMGSTLANLFGAKPGNAAGSVASAATDAAKTASDAATSASSATAVTALSTAATASSTALTTMSASVTALDTASATLTAGFGTLAAAVETASAALTASGAGNAGSAVAGAGMAASATDATSSATAAASLTALGTAATTGAAAISAMDAATTAGAASLTAMTASSTALDAVSATLAATFAALVGAAQAAAAALASVGASSGGAGIGALAGAVGGGASTDVGWEAMLAGSFAGGGDPPVGQPSLIGEKGPEIFVPKTAGTILPNDVFKNAGSSSSDQPQQSNIIHLNINVPQSTSRSAADQIAASTGLAVNRALRRNA